MSDQATLLFTGGSGRLGRACRKIAPEAQYPGRGQLNVQSAASIESYLSSNSVTEVIHMAAVASIPRCEADRSLAHDVNVLGTRRMLAACLAHGVRRFLFLSTACVFPGTDSTSMQDEDSLPDPKNYYGLTKYVAEEIVKGYYDSSMRATVVRTNFTSMPWEYPGAFTDRFGTYLFAQGVVRGLLEVIRAEPRNPIIHVCGDRKLSMYEYARLGGSEVEPMTLDQYDGPPVTVNMSLATKYWQPYSITDADYHDDE